MVEVGLGLCRLFPGPDSREKVIVHELDGEGLQDFCTSCPMVALTRAYGTDNGDP